MTARHSTRATAALQALTDRDPALAALSLWCQHRDADLHMAQTQGTEIRYGAAFAALPLHEQVGLAGHHILHVALQHSARMADMALRLGDRFAPDLWQIATDAIINDAIIQAGHALPRPALTLGGLLRALGESDVDALGQWDAERLYHRLTGEGAGRARAHAAEQGQQADLQPLAAQRTNRDAAGPDTPDRADWHAHLARAMAAGQAAGVGLGMLGQRLADLPQPRTPWEIILRRLLAQHLTPHPQPQPFRPARRWLAQAGIAVHQGRPMPLWQARVSQQTTVPRVVVGLDASGSVPDSLLELFMAELSGIARRVRAQVQLVVFDQAIRHDLPLHPPTWRSQLSALQLPRGGGTDFGPLIARAADLNASALVILSDMDGPTGPHRPRFPVIWACPSPKPPVAPFGRLVSILT
jgi:predicted metal-dependent peptidase